MITYSDFNTYPILIIGLTEENNTELAAMEVVATEMLDYSGDVVDVADIIKYLVFILFWQNRRSTMTESTGETLQVKEHSDFSSVKKNTVIYLAEKKLKEICAEKGTTANQNVFTFFYDYL